MSHFAEVDESNIVLRVLVVPDEQEHRGQEFMADDLGLGGTWKQTSYNTRGGVHKLGGTPFRYNFAGAGSTWDEANGAFYSPQPYPSWSLDENYLWQPPTPMPDDGNAYYWDEDTTSWVEVTE
jgi:hypothetical protein